MKALVYGLVLTVIASLVAGLSDAEEKAEKGTPYLEKQTGLSFPASIGDLSRDRCKEFPEAGLGVLIRYVKGDAVLADLFVYNMGVQEIPSDANGDAIVQQADKALEDVRYFEKQGHYLGLKVESRGVVPLTADAKGPKAQRIAMTFGAGDAQFTTFIYVTGYKNRFIKLRFTCPSANRKEAETQLDKLTSWLGGAIADVPAPVEPKTDAPSRVF
jgi:hypothetical protein